MLPKKFIMQKGWATIPTGISILIQFLFSKPLACSCARPALVKCMDPGLPFFVPFCTRGGGAQALLNWGAQFRWDGTRGDPWPRLLPISIRGWESGGQRCVCYSLLLILYELLSVPFEMKAFTNLITHQKYKFIYLNKYIFLNLKLN